MFPKPHKKPKSHKKMNKLVKLAYTENSSKA